MSAPASGRYRHTLLQLLGVLALASALLLLRLSSTGIWDPWELDMADTARRWLVDKQLGTAQPPLSPWLIARSFDWLAVREWAGRLPIALSGMACLGLLWAWVRALAGARQAMYASLIACTSLALIFNSRQMLGDAPTYAAGAWIALGASSAVFDGFGPQSPRVRWIWVAITALGVGVAIAAKGALLAALPPLAAVCLTHGLSGGLAADAPRERRLPGWALTGLTLFVAAWTGYDVWADTADYSPWVGGMPSGDTPPNYEHVLEVIFHGFAPWSAALPVAIGGCLHLGNAQTDGGPLPKDWHLRLTCVLWASLGYAAHTLFESRFGAASFPATPALCACVALWLDDLAQSRRGYWAAGLVSSFFVGLLIRDFALYPTSPINALGVHGAEVPEVFNPKRIWAGLLGSFGAALLLASIATAERTRLDIRAPYRWLLDQWRCRGWGLRCWLTLFGLSALSLLVFGMLCWSIPQTLGLNSLTVRIGRALAFVPPALPLAAAVLQCLWVAMSRFERFRLWPTWLAAVAIGGYAAHGFLPSLNAHFSPRNVFEQYNQFAGTDEPLAEYQVGGRSAEYYAKGPVAAKDTRSELVKYLHADERRWATFPAEELAEIDRLFRRQAGHHLFGASDPNAQVMLVANGPIEGVENQNPFDAAIRTAPPSADHTVHINFEDKIELLGYNLELPHGDYVGPGQTFEIEWIFRALHGNIGTYKIFVHADGAGNRIHGDHDPVGGKYPVKLWDEGNVIIDRQSIHVPANLRAGRYTLMVGFYRGDVRLKVTEGPHDGENRARVGHINLR